MHLKAFHYSVWSYLKKLSTYYTSLEVRAFPIAAIRKPIVFREPEIRS